MPPAAQRVVRRYPPAPERGNQDELGTVIAKWLAVQAPGRAVREVRIALEDLLVGGGRVVLRCLLDRVRGAGRRLRASRIEAARVRAGPLDRIGDDGCRGPVEPLGVVPACAAALAG
jgi:hypothetical protein